MTVFVGWPYEDNNEWIDRYGNPLIQSSGVEVLNGKELQGQVLNDGVKARIEEADAAVFFSMRRKNKRETDPGKPVHGS